MKVVRQARLELSGGSTPDQLSPPPPAGRGVHHTHGRPICRVVGKPLCAPQTTYEPQDRPSNQIKSNQIPESLQSPPPPPGAFGPFLLGEGRWSRVQKRGDVPPVFHP